MKRNLDQFVKDEIKRRSIAGKRLAKRFSDLPKGLSYVEFLEALSKSGVNSDFITTCEAFDEYKRQLGRGI
jgi:hypothetical protein